MPLLRSTGKVTFLRCHDIGTRYGPASDQIDVEVVVKLDSRPAAEAYGFTMRDDANRVAHQGMFDLLRDAFDEGWTTTLVYDIEEGRNNGLLIRVWVTKPVDPVFDFDALDVDAGILAID